MKKLSFILIIFLICLNSAHAQRKIQQLDEDEAKKQEQLKAYEQADKKFDSEKLVYGGNIGLNSFAGATQIMAQPMIGYKIWKEVIVGTGFTYIYVGYKYLGKTYSSSAYGPLLFARKNIIGEIFAHTEWQPINYQRRNPQTLDPERFWSNQLFVGGGLGQEGGQIYILYNLLFDKNSYYSNSPIYIRIGFLF